MFKMQNNLAKERKGINIKNKLEILSPAGSYESILMAANSGADAIYFGIKNFNARKNANNIEIDQLSEIITYLHVRDIKAYITVNIMVKDAEIRELEEAVLQIYLSGADAIIVSDLAVCDIVQKCAPSLKIFASTQMSVHNLDGVNALFKIGFSRVVLARELSFEDMKFIAKNSPIELEVFVHGALCMCYSGACLLSAHLGGRSGNRGLCAQPCRLEYELNRSKGNLLSLRDLCLLDEVKNLQEIGIASIKIEGRMKRSEYVGVSTNAYLMARDEEKVDEYTISQLEKVFSRDGFTKGYFDEKLSLDMFGMRKDSDKKASEKEFKNFLKVNVREGHEFKRVPLYAKLILHVGENAVFIAKDENDNEWSVYGDVVSAAINKPSTLQSVEKAICKTSNTPFYFNKVDIDLDENAFVAVSLINSMRRDILNQVEKFRQKKACFEVVKYKNMVSNEFSSDLKPKLYARFMNTNSIPEHLSGIEMVFIDLFQINKDVVNKIAKQNIKVAVVLARIIYDNCKSEVIKQLQIAKELGICDVLIQNIGGLFVLELGFFVHLDFGLNIMNSVSLDYYKRLGATSATLSLECKMSDIKDMKKPIETGIIAYGKMPLMVFKNCIIKHNSGVCDPDCESGIILNDRKNIGFILMKDNAMNNKAGCCSNILLNSKTMVLCDKNEYKKCKVNFATLFFTTEDKESAQKVINAYVNDLPLDIANKTYGLYKTGVE